MTIYSDMTLLVLLGSVIVPLLVGLLTKIDASSGVKAALNLGLTALVAGLATVSEIDFQWTAFLVNWGFGWAVSIASYYGFYKPTTIAPRLERATANFGIG